MNDLLLPGLVLGVVLGLPLALSGGLAFARPRSRLDWLLSALLCAGVAAYMYVAGPIWAWIGLGWRNLPLVATGAAVLWSARRLRARPVLPPARPWPLAGVVVRGAVAALFGGMLVNLHMGGSPPAGAVDLSFPLAGGRFVVLQGGGTVALNNHRAVPAQAWATDILALNDEGRRARGVRPEALDAYEVFDRAAVAPCDGVVLGVSDGAPDAPIGWVVDSTRPAGNHVLLFCVAGGAEVTLLLAHLRSGSVAVARGDRVRRGALLGRVGNSGRSTEPHLHIHAVRGREAELSAVIATAEAVPLTFDGRFPTRNAVVRIPDPP